MKLKLYLPQEILIDRLVKKVIAESKHGAFCLLPHHIDCLAILVPGILTYQTMEDEEVFVAVDEGILVKCDSEVRVSTRHGIQGQDLNHLKQQINRRFRILDEQERQTRTALAKLEAGLARYFTASQVRG